MPRFRSEDGFRARICLVRVGDFPGSLLEGISERTQLPISGGTVDPAPAFNPARQQYESTRLLTELRERRPDSLIVGATACDLYIPVLTFVFGEAELGGRAAVFSIHRLREEFYGLPPNRALLFDRAIREMWHEIGHLRGLPHCPDWSCVMSSSHSVERVDAKAESFCRECEERLSAREVSP